jgi:hypothetical protein
MDNNAELRHSDCDEVVIIDETTGGQGGKESAAVQETVQFTACS